MAIVNLTPDNDGPEGELCAERWYQFEETEPAIFYEWQVLSTPSAIDADDVEFTAPNNNVTFVKVPIAGNYCFKVVRGIAQ